VERLFIVLPGEIVESHLRRTLIGARGDPKDPRQSDGVDNVAMGLHTLSKPRPAKL